MSSLYPSLCGVGAGPAGKGGNLRPSWPEAALAKEVCEQTPGARRERQTDTAHTCTWTGWGSGIHAQCEHLTLHPANPHLKHKEKGSEKSTKLNALVGTQYRGRSATHKHPSISRAEQPVQFLPTGSSGREAKLGLGQPALELERECELRES